MKTKVSFKDTTGVQQEVELSLETYRAAEEARMTFPQYVNAHFQTEATQFGSTFAQMLASSGIFMSNNNDYGIRPPTVAELMTGKAHETAINLGIVSRPSGAASDTPSGRLLFPAVLLEMVENQLRPTIETYIGAFNSMIGQTVNVTSPKYAQPIVNYDAARNSRSMPIGQLARPAQMLTFTLSDIARTIPTYSIGIEISDQAASAMTIDFVAKAIAEHTVFERASRMTDDLVGIVTGDVDSTQTALSSVTATSFDPTIANAAGVLSQSAWVQFLRNNFMRRSITDVVCDVKTYLSIENRTGRVTAMNASATDERLNSVPKVTLPGINPGVNVFLTDGSPLGANTLLGLDRSKAMRRVVYVGAQYSAIEEFVMLRSKQMRMDWAERIESMGFPEAFQLMTLT